MTNQFLAEDFRKLLNKLNEVEKDDALINQSDDSEAEKHADVDDLMTTDRPEDISKESVKDIGDLIEYLDQFPDLKKYRDENAQFDDAFYSDIPLEEIHQIADLSDEDLKRIKDDTKPYGGDLHLENDAVTIFGGD